MSYLKGGTASGIPSDTMIDAEIFHFPRFLSLKCVGIIGSDGKVQPNMVSLPLIIIEKVLERSLKLFWSQQSENNVWLVPTGLRLT